MNSLLNQDVEILRETHVRSTTTILHGEVQFLPLFLVLQYGFNELSLMRCTRIYDFLALVLFLAQTAEKVPVVQIADESFGPLGGSVGI